MVSNARGRSLAPKNTSKVAAVVENSGGASAHVGSGSIAAHEVDVMVVVRSAKVGWRLVDSEPKWQDLI